MLAVPMPRPQCVLPARIRDDDQRSISQLLEFEGLLAAEERGVPNSSNVVVPGVEPRLQGALRRLLLRVIRESRLAVLVRNAVIRNQDLVDDGVEVCVGHLRVDVWIR